MAYIVMAYTVMALKATNLYRHQPLHRRAQNVVRLEQSRVQCVPYDRAPAEERLIVLKVLVVIEVDVDRSSFFRRSLSCTSVRPTSCRSVSSSRCCHDVERLRRRME